MKKLLVLSFALSAAALAADRVTLPFGVVEGLGRQASGVREFRGVPFAEPPVGDLRWAPPVAPKKRDAVIDATKFAARCMQLPLFGDMNFRANGMSEDCLYLNIWTPAKGAGDKLPVLVYFFGGGFQAGDGSEPRYDGESLATKGIVTVTVNYRLGVFGFLAHPELTKASPNHASGNYAFLDQSAAIHWVHDNIAAFGGDPKKITIGGESAGSIAVSAQMASPLARNLFAGAIGESGSILGTLAPVPLAEAEALGVKFAEPLGATTLAELRAFPADKLLEASGKPGVARLPTCIDGYFFPESPLAIFNSGKQAHVPLLAGWNSQEMGARSVLARDPPTQENFRKAVERLYGARATDVLREYAAASDAEVEQAATDLASDRFIAWSTWKWLDVQGKTGGKPTYRYFYSRPRPKMRPEMGDAVAGLAGGVVRGSGQAPQPPAKGAVHSAEIEYALGNLSGNKVYAWEPDDEKVSATMEQFFANFVKTGNPNGNGLPKWPAANKSGTVSVMHLDVTAQVEPEKHRGRYLLLEQISDAK
ncbi:MAG TPA: carboxylesterase family protein [Bryobacteraceae bacterium]|nr:carboxylesterase family protein [Bryobacteraceae bacterium]